MVVIFLEDNQKKIICATLEVRYIKLMKEKKEYSMLKKHQIMSILFPSNWINNGDYDWKIKLLSEAIKSNTNILKLPSFRKLVESIIHDEIKKYNDDNL